MAKLKVDGRDIEVPDHYTLLQAAEEAGAEVPRFCFHERLSIAGNCRMCLVEVKGGPPKPQASCAMGVKDLRPGPNGEVPEVFTNTPMVKKAREGVMEFLLINHPLDCPICDQGGECELQDLAMGFGRDISRYNERKRVVKDKNLGPLVSTDMTRCIHCTRCVRFTQDVQGFQELGTLGRGEMTEIGTFIEKSVDHELSANIIDLCPVGALNNKPYRYRARAWEMTQHPLISPHDAVGTNIYAHVLRGRVMRIVPRANEEVNETWIADRDRFSYQGIYSEDRLLKPSVRENGVLQETDWETALQKVAEKLGRIAKQQGGGQIGAVASPNSTLEELHLLARIARGLGSANLDHRLRRSDFRDDASDPLFPSLGVAIKDLETANSVLIVGSNIRKEVPLLAHRIRKAALKGGKVSFINAQCYDYLFPVAGYLASNGIGSLDHLVAVAAAAVNASGKTAPASIASLLGQAQPNDTHKAIAQQLSEGERRLILLGAIAQRDPAFADLRLVASALAEVTGATLGYLPEGGNAVGAHLVGFLPGRSVGGQAVAAPGLNVADMFAAKLKAYIVFGAIEPQLDLAAGTALTALEGAEFVVALSPYSTAAQFADVVLPIGTFAETAGTYVNLEGRWQSVPGAASPVGESRPGWKVLRVLANLLDLPGFEYTAADQVTAEIRKAVDEAGAFTAKAATRTLQAKAAGAPVVRDVPIYQVDAMVRRSSALQNTREGRETVRGQGA